MINFSNLGGLVNNNTKFIVCPKCYKVPSIEIISVNPEFLSIQCKCGYSETKEVEAVIDGIRTKGPSTEKCKIHKNRLGNEYCVNCERWICEECINYHNTVKQFLSHHRMKDQVDLEVLCPQHKGEYNQNYCLTCNKTFCNETASNHNEHQTEKLEEIFTLENFKEVKSKVHEAVNHLLIYRKELKDTMIKILKDKIEKVQKMYDYNNKINMNIINLIQILIENCSNFLPNYNAYKNLIYNTQFDLDTCDIDVNNFGSSLNKVISYFQNKFITDQFRVNFPDIELTQVLLEHKSSVNSICFLKDNRLATCSSDRTIKIFNPQDNFKCEIEIIRPHRDGVRYITQMKNETLISCSNDGDIKFWKLKGNTYETEGIINAHPGEFIFKVLEISNNRIASCSSDHKIKFFSYTQPFNEIKSFVIPESKIFSILFIEQKEILVSSSYDNENPNNETNLSFWSTLNYTLISTLDEVGFVTGCDDLIQINEQEFAVGSLNSILIVSADSRTIVRRIEDDCFGFVRSLFKTQEEYLICGCGFKGAAGLIFIDLMSERVAMRIDDAHSGLINGVTFNGTILATCSQDNSVKIWKI